VATGAGLAKDYSGDDFDLVTYFDCLPDMGDPACAAARLCNCRRRRSMCVNGNSLL